MVLSEVDQSLLRQFPDRPPYDPTQPTSLRNMPYSDADRAARENFLALPEADQVALRQQAWLAQQSRDSTRVFGDGPPTPAPGTGNPTIRRARPVPSPAPNPFPDSPAVARARQDQADTRDAIEAALRTTRTQSVPVPAPDPQWRRVQPHWWKPTPRLLGSSGSTRIQRVGIELEVSIRGSCQRSYVVNKAFEAVDAILPRLGADRREFFHVETDSSVSHGLEFVTAALSCDPTSYDPQRCEEAALSWRALDALAAVLRDAADFDASRNSCGMHVHITRRAVWAPPQRAPAHSLPTPGNAESPYQERLRLQQIIFSLLPPLMAGTLTHLPPNTSTFPFPVATDRWQTFTGRAQRMPSYCQPRFSSETLRCMFSADEVAGKWKGGDRYVSLNHNNAKTFEFRSPGGMWETPNWHRIAIEMAHSLEEFAWELSAQPFPDPNSPNTDPTTLPEFSCRDECRKVRSAAISVHSLLPFMRGSGSPTAWPIMHPGPIWQAYQEFVQYNSPRWLFVEPHLAHALRAHPIT